MNQNESGGNKKTWVYGTIILFNIIKFSATQKEKVKKIFYSLFRMSSINVNCILV